MKSHPAGLCGFWVSVFVTRLSLLCHQCLLMSLCSLRAGYRNQFLAQSAPQWCLDQDSLGKCETQGEEWKFLVSPIETSVEKPFSQDELRFCDLGNIRHQ